MTAKIEMIKDHSTTLPLAAEAKKLMLKELTDDGEHSAASYLESSHFGHKWTLVELNDPTFLPPGASAGGEAGGSASVEASAGPATCAARVLDVEEALASVSTLSHLICTPLASSCRTTCAASSSGLAVSAQGLDHWP